MPPRLDQMHLHCLPPASPEPTLPASTGWGEPPQEEVTKTALHAKGLKPGGDPVTTTHSSHCSRSQETETSYESSGESQTKPSRRAAKQSEQKRGALRGPAFGVANQTGAGPVLSLWSPENLRCLGRMFFHQSQLGEACAQAVPRKAATPAQIAALQKDSCCIAYPSLHTLLLPPLAFFLHHGVRFLFVRRPGCSQRLESAPTFRSSICWSLGSYFPGKDHK